MRAGFNDEKEEAAQEAARAAAIEPELSSDEDPGVFYCGQIHFETAVVEQSMCGEDADREEETLHSPVSTMIDTTRTTITSVQDANQGVFQEPTDVAIETTMTQNASVVMLYGQDAPSQVSTFAIKILNPVGYRILQIDTLKGSVVV